MIGIYKITNIINEKSYIGQSKNIDHRIYCHKLSLENGKHYNKHLQRAYNKYGCDNFEFSVLDECDTVEDLFDREIYWIAYYDSFYNGYNESLGGESGSRGRKATEDEKKKKSESMMGERNHFYGKKHTEVSLKKMSKASKGRKRSKESIEKGTRRRGEHSSAVPIITNDKRFGCIKDCADYYGVSDITMRSWLDGSNKMPTKYKRDGLMYENTELRKRTRYMNEVNTCEIECDGVIYESIAECSRKYNISTSMLFDYMNGRCSMRNDFVDMGLRYTNRDTIIKQKISGCRKCVVLDNIVYPSIMKLSEVINLNKSTIGAWLSGQNKMPREYIELGLRCATKEECNTYKEENTKYLIIPANKQIENNEDGIYEY